MKVYEYIVFYNGKKSSKKDDNGWEKKPSIISQATLLAKDDKEVSILAARSIPDEFIEELDSVTIAVRPF